jgi:hypothetical protein
MPEYDDTNRGVLFKNAEKKTPKHPDYSGKLNVDGREYFLDAWIKEGKSGKFMSVSVKEKTRPAAKPAQSARPSRPAAADDDSCPF